jgi:hypothetical protein
MNGKIGVESSLSYECLAYLSKNTTACEYNLGWPEGSPGYGPCIMDIASEPKTCEKILQYSEDTGDDWLYDGCIENVAVSKRDVSICDKMKDPFGTDRYRCILDIAMLTQDESICMNYLKSSDAPGEECLYTMKVLKNGISVCDRLQENEKPFCIYVFSKLNNDPSLCDRLDNSLLLSKDECLHPHVYATVFDTGIITTGQS